MSQLKGHYEDGSRLKTLLARKTRCKRVVIQILGVLCLSALATSAFAAADAVSGSSVRDALSIPLDPAAKEATYRIELVDGVLTPAILKVPSGVRFKLLIVNSGSKPSEFESHQLRQEVVLFMGKDKILSITPLDPGSYDYLDDFQPGVGGQIVVLDTSADTSADTSPDTLL